ncbi:MAG: hypothetical protein ACJA1R_002528 [Flavobacteriales bacterium]
MRPTAPERAAARNNVERDTHSGSREPLATGAVREAVEQRFTASGPIIAPNGDPNAARELPSLGVLLTRTTLGIVAGFLLALLPTWFASTLVEGAASQHPSVFIRTGGLSPLREIFGGDPGVYGFWFLATSVVVLLQTGLERFSRNMWIPALLIALVGGLAFANPPRIDLLFTGWDFGGALGSLRGFADACLPERWPLVISVGALGVLASRRGDSALLLITLVIACVLTFEMHVAREAAISNLLASAEMSLSLRLERTGSVLVADAQNAVTLARSSLYVRAVADVWFLLLPAWVVSTRD